MFAFGAASDEWEQNVFFSEHLKFVNLDCYSLSKQSDTLGFGQKQIDIHPFLAQPFPSAGNENANNALSNGGLMNSSWPMQSHDNLHTGRSSYTTANNTGGESWRFRCGQIDGGMVIGQDGTIYFGDKASYPTYMYAVYPNGTLKWRYQLGNGVYWVCSTPAIADDGTIYIGTMGGGFYAFNPNGSLRWHTTWYADIASSPAIAPDGTIYYGNMAGGDEGYIVALNPNGTLKWTYVTGYYITSDPAIGPDGTIYIGSGDTYLYAMNPGGTLKWRFKTGDIIKGQASIAADGTVYISSFDQQLYALYPNNGTVKWQMYLWGSEGTPAIAADGTIYVGSDKLYAVYPNGTMRWAFDLGSTVLITQSAPAISADGTIYVGTVINGVYGGDIIAVNPNGTERWHKLIADEWVRSSPAIDSDGTVYIGSSSEVEVPLGFLYAFNQGPLEADPGGPYSGEPNKPVQFRSNVLGGIPLYTYVWSFGDGGTSTTRNPSHTYTQSGLYNVTLLVTDSEGNSSSNSTTAFINAPPNTPVISGSSQGKIRQVYTYTFVTTDPEGDNVYYYINWGDGTGTNFWIGHYKSGEEINMSKKWIEKGTYTIQCKAKDIYGQESDWGTLQVTMPLSYEPPHFRFLDWLFERFPHAFPILQFLLKR